MFELAVQERDMKKKPAVLREGGVLPAVFYGPKEEVTSIAVDTKMFEKMWKEAGSSSIVILKGIGEDKEALIQEVDVHPVTGALLHVDLYVIERGKKLEVDVPLEFVGEAPAEKAGHSVIKVIHEITISVRPSELPHSLTIDLSGLEKVGDHISVHDVKIPESAEFITNPEEVVVSVKEVTVEKEPEKTPEVEAEGGEAPAPGEEGEAKKGEE